MNTNASAQKVQNCRWSACTLFLPKPYWLDAWDSPWSCWMREEPRTIGDTSECARCQNWEAGAPKLPGAPYFC